MELRKLQPGHRDLEKLEEINVEAFPPEERLEIDELFSFDVDAEVLGAYEEGELAGFAFMLKSETVVYVTNLAIDKDHRGMGIGSHMLGEIIAANADKQIVLDFEPLIPEAENYEQRLARKRFYLRNGFHETGRFSVWGDDKYEVVCTEGDLDVSGVQGILDAMSRRMPESHATLL